MRILVFGGAGMAGHMVAAELATRHTVWATVRQEGDSALLRGVTPLTGIDVRSREGVSAALDATEADVLVNCVGIVKQRPIAAVEMLEVNALFPHRLAELALDHGATVIHLSTDCVFSGRRGGYTEDDLPDPPDFYGVSKLAGELTETGLTLRTSIIGLELQHRTSLVEWALAQRRPIRGYARAIFSGVTTNELARVIGDVVERHRDLRGLWHLASEPISKFDLLSRLFERIDREIEVQPDDSFICDRSLVGKRFSEAIGYAPPEWDVMIDELAASIRAREATV